jgi:hypothetical protein
MPADQESAQNKEQVDADPAVQERRDQVVAADRPHGAARSRCHREGGMAQQDQNDRQRPQAVERVDAAANSVETEIARCHWSLPWWFVGESLGDGS